ncbi:MAG: HlyD family secretion protein [Syntrophomonas sp.]
MSQETEAVEKNNSYLESGNKKRKVTAVIVLAAVIIMAAISIWQYQLRTAVSTDNAKVSGDVVDVSPRVAGRLEHLLVKEQDVVKAGQVLAQLDNTQYKAALDQAQAALDLAQANYEKLPTDVKSMQAAYAKAQEGYTAAEAKVKSCEVSVADAKRVMDQNESLYRQGAVSKEALESSRTRYNSAQATLEMEQANALVAMEGLNDAEARRESMKKTGASIYIAQLKQAQAVYKSALFNYENSTVKAPVDGTVVRVVSQEGENVASSQTVLSLCNLNASWITANIEENKIDRVKAGQHVDIKIDAYPGRVLKGRVEAIGNATQSTFSLLPTESTSGNYTKVIQRIAVKISALKSEVVLKPGMSAYIKIYTGSK